MSGLIGRLWWAPAPFANARVTMAYTETAVVVIPHARVTMAYTETVVKP